MTYETARISARIGPVSMSGPAPAPRIFDHGMTMAEMAHKEGHRPGVPRTFRRPVALTPAGRAKAEAAR